MHIVMNPFFFVCLLLFCILGCSDTKQISKRTEETNKRFPEMITDVLRIDSLKFEKRDHTLRYYYSILSDSLIDAILEKDIRKVQKEIAIEIKHSKTMQYFRSKKLTFEYIYISDGNVITKIKVTHSEYR